ncbi:MAG TPA: hypothetical protein VJT10_16605 [Steroidobacteraceae bacterium]|nr:hypothetical protein [Steroidobacteraceae bacterium]
MSEAEDSELFYKLIKVSGKQAVKYGSSKTGLPDDVSKFLAGQLSFAFDLIKKGSKITPGYLAVLLAQKGLGIADLAVSQRYDCAITVLLLGTSLTKSIALTTFTGPAHFAVTAAELLAECYSVDKSCGVSDAISQQIDEVTLPAAMWLEQGVMQWISRGGR